MPKFIIQGGKKLAGEISVKGAKNAALKIIPAALLSDQPITITNLPAIEDIDRLLEIIEDMGGQVQRQGDTCTIAITKPKTELNASLANKLRASVMFVGPLLARMGEVKFPHPGGCVIGAGTRPIDLFLEGFAAMGAEISVKHDHYHLKAKKLKGCEFFFTTVSVTGTESLLMTAVLAEGTTILKNCAMEPEITALAEYLNSQGAKITGAGTPTITIVGVDKISAGNFKIIPDRPFGATPIGMVATHPSSRYDNCESSVLIDATRKADFPPLSLPKKEYMERAKEIWQELGLPKLEPQAPWHGYLMGFWPEELELEANLAAKSEHEKVWERLQKTRVDVGEGDTMKTMRARWGKTHSGRSV